MKIVIDNENVATGYAISLYANHDDVIPSNMTVATDWPETVAVLENWIMRDEIIAINEELMVDLAKRPF